MDLRVTPSCLRSTGAQHPFLYALTTLFPSISRYKRSHTRAYKQDSNSNNDPIFLTFHFHSVKWPIPRVLLDLIIMALTRIYTPSLLLSWRTVWILTTVILWPTLTNLFWPAAPLSMINLQPRIRRRDANTCHQHPHRPYYREQASRPTFCAHVNHKRNSSHALPLPTRFWPLGDLLSQTILARSFLWETTVPSFFGRLQHGRGFGRLLSQPLHFLAGDLFLFCPYSPLQI